MDIKGKAIQLIKKYGTDDPFRIAAELNIRLIYAPLGGACGNYMKYKRTKLIILDRDKAPEQMLPFVCAHELGHSVCTPDENTELLQAYSWGLDSRVERRANLFAVELLLNDDYLRANVECSIYTLGAMRGIPEDIIGLKELPTTRR